MAIKRAIIIALKILVSAAILGYLFWDAHRNQAFGNLWEQPKRWPLLGCAFVLCLTAVVLTLIRWCYLVRALGMRFPMRDAFRMGFLGYLFNLAPMGIVGGDVLKMVLLAREQRAHRPEAVATVVVDRLIGLYTLFLVASVAVMATSFWQSPSREVRLVSWATIAVTALGTIGVMAVLSPRTILEPLKGWFAKLPYAGRVSVRLLEAVDQYRRRLPTLLGSVLISFAVHSCFTIGVFLIASGLYAAVPSLGMHFVACPLSASAQVLPLPMGPSEFVLDRLYLFLPVAGGPPTQPGQGLVIMLAYRLITLLIAGVGICYYFTSRSEVAEVLHEAQCDSSEVHEPAGSAV